MTHKQLTKMIAKQTGYRLYEVEDVLNGLTYVVRNLLKDNRRFYFRGLGTFKIKQYANRLAYNPVLNMVHEHQGRKQIRVTFDKNLMEGIQ